MTVFFCVVHEVYTYTYEKHNNYISKYTLASIITAYEC